MSQSLRIGIDYARKRFLSVMILLGDQPLIDTTLIDILINRFRSSDKEACLPVCRGKKGHPVIFARRFFEDIMSIKGDTGARDILTEHPDRILTVEIPSAGIFFDIDTPADVETLLSDHHQGE